MAVLLRTFNAAEVFVRAPRTFGSRRHRKGQMINASEQLAPRLLHLERPEFTEGYMMASSIWSVNGGASLLALIIIRDHDQARLSAVSS